MENLRDVLQQLNIYQERINTSTKSGSVDQEAHVKQSNLLQDLVSGGIELGKQIWYDAVEEKYKIADEWKHLLGEVTGQVTGEAEKVAGEVEADILSTVTPEVSTPVETPVPAETTPSPVAETPSQTLSESHSEPVSVAPVENTPPVSPEASTTVTEAQNSTSEKSQG